MTLPQSAAAFKTMLLGLLLVYGQGGSPALAQDAAPEDDPHLTLFSCATDGEADMGFLSLSGVEHGTAAWTDLRFDRLANGDGSPVYRFDPGADYKTAFLFSHSDGPEGYLVSIRWTDQETDYVYYSLDIPPDPNLGDDLGGGEAGLTVSKDGALVERVACTERPYMFIGYMRDAMSCDVDNPYGEVACGEATPVRPVPLDVEQLGVVMK